MAVRRVVITEDGQVAQDVHAGRVERHQHHRLLRVALRGEVGLAHHDRDLAARIARARRPPLGVIGSAHVCTPVTNAHIVCRLLLEKKKKKLSHHANIPTEYPDYIYQKNSRQLDTYY